MSNLAQKKTIGNGSKRSKAQNVPELDTMILEQIAGAETALSIDMTRSRRGMHQAVASALRCLRAAKGFALLVNHEAAKGVSR